MSILGERMSTGFELAQAVSETLERIEQQIADARDEIQARGDRDQFARRAIVGIADAAGIADLTYSVPVGLGARILSAACSGSAPGANVEAALYLGDPSNDANLIHVFNYNLARFSSVFAEGEYLPAGGTITVRFRGQTVGQRCTVNLKLVVENPADPITVH